MGGLAGACKGGSRSGEPVATPTKEPEATTSTGAEAPAPSGLRLRPLLVTLPLLDAAPVRTLDAARAVVVIAKDGSQSVGAAAEVTTTAPPGTPAMPFIGLPVMPSESLAEALAAVAPPTEAEVAAAKEAAEAAARAGKPSCRSVEDDGTFSALVGTEKQGGKGGKKPAGKPGAGSGGAGSAPSAVQRAVIPRVAGVLELASRADALVLADAASSAARVVASIHALGGRRATIGVAGGGTTAAGAVSYRLAAATTPEWRLSRIWISFDGRALELQEGGAADPAQAEVTRLPLVDGKLPHERLVQLLNPTPQPRGASVGVVLGRDVTTQQLVDLFGAITAAGAAQLVLIAQPEGTLDPLPSGPKLGTLLVDECR